MNNPLVSVVIATYRRTETLRRALDSLASQNNKDFEIILVDDNGNKEWNCKVESIVASFKEDNPSVKMDYIQNNPNQGSAKTRNIGINVARGKYVTFLDDDDLYLPDKINNQVSLMEKEKADFCLMNLSLYNENESLCEIRRRFYLEEEGNHLLLCHLKYHMTGTDTMMFRTDYIKGFGGFEPIDVGDEFYLMMKAIEANGKFVYADCCDVKAYIHTGEGGLSSGQGKIDGENSLFDFKKKYFSKLKRKDIRYIKMRHHAVLAFAYKRHNKMFRFIVEGAKAFLTSPIQSLHLIRGLK